MKLLVLAPEPVDADAVKGALPDVDLASAEVMVIAPALNQSPLAFWVSDPDEAIAEAEQAKEQSVGALREEAGRVRGATGESEPLLALQDALATFEADRILIFVRPDDEQAYREDEVVGKAAEQFGLPVDQATL
jgi:hypothetical protein